MTTKRDYQAVAEGRRAFLDGVAGTASEDPRRAQADDRFRPGDILQRPDNTQVGSRSPFRRNQTVIPSAREEPVSGTGTELWRISLVCLSDVAMRTCHVYILSSQTRTLYVGVTSDLSRRLAEHRAKIGGGFAAKYNVTRLVHVESFDSISEAILREKQIKGWRRSKKLALVRMYNPKWRDLAGEL